ncbi:MAG TPA: hypothetical protein VKY19_16505 [Ktedonosporobacter sp.]|jgi:hypothetical protein|nr:hypothetical protein [Ktedonosporobacter sp.]
MEEMSQEIIPQIWFSLQELATMADVLRGYHRYLQKASASGKHAGRIRFVAQLQGRMAQQLTTGDVKQVQLFLTAVELEELLAVLDHFVSLIKRLFPKNEERDAVVATVHVWRLRLSHVLKEFDM